MARPLAYALLVTLAAPVVLTAQPAPTTGGFSGPTTTPSGSYLNLQPGRRPSTRPLLPPALPVERRQVQEARWPRVVCGMTILQGEATIDPGMTARLTPPAARPTVRAVEPPICRSSQEP